MRAALFCSLALILASTLLGACGGDDSSQAGSGGAGATGSGGAGAGGGAGGSGNTGGGGSGGGGPSASGCEPLPPPSGNVIEVTPAQAGELPGILLAAQAGDTILLQDGDYLLGGATLQVAAPGVTVRSQSGDRAAVVLDGEWASPEILFITASDVTIADLTVTRAINHPVHVTPGGDGDVTGVLLYNLAVIDPGQQAIKINPDAARTSFVDDGTVACSHIELTDDGRAHVQGCYTGGIDAHQARGWRVYDNTITGFWCNDGLSEHAVHFWTGGRDTVIERNTIVDCARGVGLGLGDATAGRTYADDPCPGVANVGHYGGVVRNNFVYASIAGFDSGISLEQACGASVLHNTVVSTGAPFSSIEWRFAGTSATIVNNLVSHNLVERDGAQASASGNIEGAAMSLFVDAAAGDLHLRSDAAAAIDMGAAVPDGLVVDDIDGDARAGAPDVGADEVTSP